MESGWWSRFAVIGALILEGTPFKARRVNRY